MNKAIFFEFEKYLKPLKIDLSAQEFYEFVEYHSITQEQLDGINLLIHHIGEKKIQATIDLYLRTSRLPLTAPKTFENFDFSVIRGKEVDKLKSLPSLSAIYAHKNLAFIGPPGTGKTHLAQAFGYECCINGMKAYFIKMSELRDKFTMARRNGKEASCLNGLVRAACLIIDEVGHCQFDKENTRLFFDLIDRRYNNQGCNNIIFTSNKNPSHWRENFDDDNDLLCALDRIFDDATVFNIRGESFRGKSLENVTLKSSKLSTSNSVETPIL